MTLLLRAPGVYRAQDDTSLLVDELNRSGIARGRTVLDVGTGSGAIAVAAARAGASAVTAVDLSFRSVLTARANARLHRAHVDVHRGDLFAPVAGRLFDLVLTNPPYVPSRGGATLDRLADAGLDATVRTRARIPLGPVLRRRLPILRRNGLMGPDQQDEGLVVIEARRPD